MVRLVSFVFCLLSVVLSATAGDCYTNLAGRVIAATPVKVEGGTVSFDCGAQGLRALPMDVFPPGEQARIKAAVGIREMPGELRALAAEIASQRARDEARAKAGLLSSEKLAEKRRRLGRSWNRAVDKTALSDEDKSYWKGMCP